jgi:hypothetical protein
MSNDIKQAVREVFDSLPEAFPGREEADHMRIISLDILTEIIKKVHQGDLYTQGYMKGFDDAAEISTKVISEVFTKNSTSYAEEAHAEKA